MNWLIDLLVFDEDCNKKIIKVVVVILSVVYIGSFMILARGGLR